MIVPCMVNSWLYCSGVKNCKPGLASSARMINAITPPKPKNAIDVVMYILPSVFGSVVRMYPRSLIPGETRSTGEALAGRGGASVMISPPGQDVSTCEGPVR